MQLGFHVDEVLFYFIEWNPFPRPGTTGHNLFTAWTEVVIEIIIKTTPRITISIRIVLDGYTLSSITWPRTCHPETEEISGEVQWPSKTTQNATGRQGMGPRCPKSSLVVLISLFPEEICHYFSCQTVNLHKIVF